MINLVFGDLTVISYAGRTRNNVSWNCLCKCGHTTAILGYNLKSGASKTCGFCSYKTDHAQANKSWSGARQRCSNPNDINYKNYGGRGIKFDPRWDKFADFLADMGDPPVDEKTGHRYTLDRIDVNGNYTKENCRWADRKTQALNKRTCSPNYCTKCQKDLETASSVFDSYEQFFPSI